MKHTESSFKIMFVIILAALLFSGCRGGRPQAEFYTLSAIAHSSTDADAISAAQPVSIGIGPVNIPEVLARPQIVSRMGPNKLRINEFHRWGGTLEANFSRVLAENVSLLLRNNKVVAQPWERYFHTMVFDQARNRFVIHGALRAAQRADAAIIIEIRKASIRRPSPSGPRPPDTGSAYRRRAGRKAASPGIRRRPR